MSNALNQLPRTGPGGTFYARTPPPYGVNDEAVLRCDTARNFRPPPNTTSRVVSQNNTLMWVPAQIDCIPPLCKPPHTIPNGTLHHDTVYPETIQYECNPGYRLNQFFTKSICDPVTGLWKPPVPKTLACEPILCPPLLDPANGSVTGVGDRKVGAVATLQCEPGYAMTQGAPTRECQADGTWSGSEVACGRLPCRRMHPSVEITSQLMDASKRVQANEITCGGGRKVYVPCLPIGRWAYRPPHCNQREETNKTLNFDTLPITTEEMNEQTPPPSPTTPAPSKRTVPRWLPWSLVGLVVALVLYLLVPRKREKTVVVSHPIKVDTYWSDD